MRLCTPAFRISTLEDWTDVFYINYYGCDMFSGGIYLSNETTPGSVVCSNPRATPIVSTFFFFFFILISSMVLLSMFIGAITISMSECVNQISIETKQAAKEQQAQLEMKLLAEYEAKIKGIGSASTTSAGTEECNAGEKKQHIPMSIGAVLKRNKEAKLVAVIKECITGKRTVVVEELHRLWVVRQYHSLSKPCGQIAENVCFQQFMLGVICVTGVVVGASTGSDIQSSPMFRAVSMAWNLFASTMFAVEVGLRFIGMGLRPHRSVSDHSRRVLKNNRGNSKKHYSNVKLRVE
jgi:hypothetical protein